MTHLLLKSRSVRRISFVVESNTVRASPFSFAPAPLKCGFFECNNVCTNLNEMVATSVEFKSFANSAFKFTDSKIACAMVARMMTNRCQAPYHIEQAMTVLEPNFLLLSK